MTEEELHGSFAEVIAKNGSFAPVNPVRPPSWSLGIPFWLRKKLPVITTPKPETTGDIILGKTCYKMGRRQYEFTHMQDEEYTFCDWDLVYSTLAKAYREWFPQFVKIFFDCDDYVWRAKGLVDAVIFARVLEMLAAIAMAAMHSNKETAKMAFFYSWVQTPKEGHMRCAGIDREGLKQFEPQRISDGPFMMPKTDSGYLIMG